MDRTSAAFALGLAAFFVVCGGTAPAPVRANQGGSQPEAAARKEAASEDTGWVRTVEGLGRAEILGAVRMTWAEAEGHCATAVPDLEDEAEGRLLTVRSNGMVRRVFTSGGESVLCENETVESAETFYVDPDLAPAVEAARRDLAERLNVSLDAVEAARAEKVVWPDSSLGCPQPDRVYMQVLTRGARLVLEVEGRSYAYHLAEGGAPLFCAKPSAVKPLPTVEYE